MKLTLLGLMLIGFQQAHYESPNHAFTLENYDKLSAVPGALHAEVTGSDFHAQARDRGIELTGKSALLDAAKDGKGGYFLTAATVSGGATIVQDTKVAHDFAVESAKAEHTAIPAEKPDQARMVLTSERFTYAGDESHGTVTLPAPFAINRQSHTVGTVTVKKQKEQQIADETVEAHGVSGVISFSTPGTDVNALRTGTINGPIAIHYVRNTTTGGKKDPETVIDGSADKIDLDFVAAVHTITLTGNVRMEGKSSVYSGFTKASIAVIVFGADGKIERIDMTGHPTDTIIKPQPKTGGGGG